MKKHLIVIVSGVLFISFAMAGTAMARRISVSIKNLTHGIYFTPLLISAHDKQTHLFQVGEPASEALQAMAEGGDIAGLSAALGGADRDTIENPAGGLLGPGESVDHVALNPIGHRHRYLSLVAMMLPTNDGFVGLDALKIPFFPGTYRYTVLGYDAGTEVNDEQITGGGAPGVPGIPADPGGQGGTGGTGVVDHEVNHMVHVHRGVIGDDDPDGGSSDLNRAVHRWLNPVAEVTITVHPRRHYR